MLQQTNNVITPTRSYILVGLVALVGVLPFRVVATNQSVPSAGSTGAVTVPPPPPPPQVPGPPPPVVPDSDTDIAASANTYYAYALFDNTGGHAVTEEHGSSADEVIVNRLHSDNGSMFWFRRGDKSYLIRDQAYIDHAYSIYAPVRDYWRDEGAEEGAVWAVKGPLAGLSSRQRSIEDQRRQLLAEKSAGYEQRLATLDDEESNIAHQVADLKRRLTSLQPRIDTMARHRQQLVLDANRNASHLVDAALAKGLAVEVGR